MATTSIVSILLEGGSLGGGTTQYLPQYTMECGAALIAKESVQELHELFEVALVETNEAALGAYLEGASDVMESATYGPVFEAADKKAGASAMDFLRGLMTKVGAFFRNIMDRVTLAFNDYQKFYDSKKEALAKAKDLPDVPCIVWHEDAIKRIPSTIKTAKSSLVEFNIDITTKIKEILDGGDEELCRKEIESIAKGAIDGFLSSIGVPAPSNNTPYTTTELHKKIYGLFREDKTQKKTVNAAYVKDVLEKTKEAVSTVKTAQKEFDSGYKEIIGKIRKLVELAEKSQKKGVSQYIHKTVSTLSKMQNCVNVYSSAGFSTIVARATEAKAITNAICSGKVPGVKEK